MNKINDLGLQLIEYKDEYHKEYSDIVIDALSLAMDQMVKNDIIDRTAVDLIKNKDVSKKDFKEFLLESTRYSKTEEEIREEMEVIRNKLNEKINDRGIVGVESKSKVELESFFIIKTVGIDEKFIQKYFGVEDKELGSLMKRKGFAEKFASLRLLQVLKEIIEELESDGISGLKSSLVYFNKNEDGFDIDLIYQVGVDEVVNNEEEVVDVIEEINNKLNELFVVKMQMDKY